MKINTFIISFLILLCAQAQIKESNQYQLHYKNTLEGDCGQGDDSNDIEEGMAVGIDVGFSRRSIDDFFVSANSTLNVKSIELSLFVRQGSDPIESINFNFYNDEFGTPGSTLVQSVSATPYAQVFKKSFEFLWWEYDIFTVLVEVDLNFEGGNTGAAYWMQPEVVIPGLDGEIFWECTSTGTLGNFIHASEDFGPWSSQMGLNGVFKLHCDVVEAPEPGCFGIMGEVAPISRVTIVEAGIDNPSNRIMGEAPALEDFSHITGYMNQGQSYEIKLSGTTGVETHSYFTAFIDWNQNGILNDEGEVYQLGSIYDSFGHDDIQAVSQILVPQNAPDGRIKMRIIKSGMEFPMNPCGFYSLGQAEDYSIQVGEMAVEDLSNSSLSIYPNPVKDILNIKSKDQIQSVSIYNLAGQKMLEKAKLLSNKQIDLSFLKSGVYMVKVYLNNGEIKSFKIVKE